MAAKTKARVVQYRDRKTGRFVAAATWRQSKSKGGTHYVRESRKRTRRRRMVPKAPPALPKAAPPPKRRDFLIALDLRGGRGKQAYRVRRDFIVPAPENATFRELKRIVLETVGDRLKPLAREMTKDNVTISQGPRTRRKKAELR